jgi:hypothetical protein
LSTIELISLLVLVFTREAADPIPSPASDILSDTLSATGLAGSNAFSSNHAALLGSSLIPILAH